MSTSTLICLDRRRRHQGSGSQPSVEGDAAALAGSTAGGGRISHFRYLPLCIVRLDVLFYDRDSQFGAPTRRLAAANTLPGRSGWIRWEARMIPVFVGIWFSCVKATPALGWRRRVRRMLAAWQSGSGARGGNHRLPPVGARGGAPGTSATKTTGPRQVPRPQGRVRDPRLLGSTG